MPDWDGDGKQTWKDDYIYHEILNKKKESTTNRSKNSSSGGRNFIIILMVIVLCWELFNVIAEAIC